jgi:uncharacterized protein YndB with AHSA1/START domain
VNETLTNATRTEPERHAIVVEEVLPHPPEKVWRVLTQSEFLAQWLMPNDFQLIAGQRFEFRTQPMGDWDGVVQCQVLEILPLRRLRYSWIGGSDNNREYGSKLNSTVTWTLTPVAEGTRVRMEHDGFGPHNDFAFKAMSPGWGRVLARISTLAGQVL